MVTDTMIAEFIIQNFKPAAEWTLAPVIAWVNWFRRDGRCAVISDAGKVVAVALARPISPEQDPEQHYQISPTSPTIFVDLVIGSRAIMAEMMEFIPRRFPNVARLKFARFKGGKTRHRDYDFSTIKLRINHG
tara:strand:+ start:13430 stop:13828 length:399 start_codon:yes stop_codon:yes gene_type:complete